jgi:hypothetical protein
MITVIRMLDPVSFGERIFFPIVRDSMTACNQGIAVVMSPVALLLVEAGAWMFVPIEEGTGPDILEKLS